MKWAVSNILFGKYEVSENADIRSIKTGRILKKCLNKKHNRFYVSISHKGKIYCKKVSRIVADAFLPNPNDYSDVNHINGDKKDDRLLNLEWTTRSKNIIHAYDVGLKTRKHKKIIKQSNNGVIIRSDSRAVVKYDKNMLFLGEYPTIREAARANGVDHSNLTNHLNGKRFFNTVKDCIYKYKNR